MGLMLPRKAANARKAKRVLGPVRPDRSARAAYYRALMDQVRYLQAQTAKLGDLAASGAERARVAQALALMSEDAKRRAAAAAPGVVRRFVDEVDRRNRERLESAIARGMGVEFARVIDTPEVQADMQMALTRNVGLVQSITERHLAAVGEAVAANYSGQAMPGGAGSLMERLQQLGDLSDNRARLIARDQTSKLAGDLNASRQRAAGIEEYDWGTSDDSRVVGTPGGRYPVASNPEVHGDHYERQGKRFRWDQPPPDGHPGQAIQCRCYARPVLNLETLVAQYV
jgi:SPP1 gp7 family putative phage head morphogenesis protein